MAVCDGMGGERSGSKASSMASDVFFEHFEEGYEADMDAYSVRSLLLSSVSAANSVVYTTARMDYQNFGMGTTCVAAFVSDTYIAVANVGDSRLYLLRDSLAQITRDHSLVEEMVARGKMERDSESYRSQKNIITRAMGIGNRVEADFFEVPLLECDCILLCSDGLTNMVDDAEISRVLKTTDTLKEKTEALVDEANRNGGKDNIAIVLVEPQISEVKL